MVTALVGGALVLRSLESPRLSQGLLAGLVGGWAIALKPANALFLVAAAVAYLLAWRWRQALAFAVALAPALITLALWKQRGLGQLPVFSLGETHEALGSGGVAIQASIDRYTHIDWGIWKQNMSTCASSSTAPGSCSGRRSRARSRSAGGRSGRAASSSRGSLAYVIVKGSSPVSSIETGSFWRLVMPAWPAYLILLAAVPLLVPTFQRRLGSRLDPPRPTPARTWVVVVAAVVLAACLSSPSPPPASSAGRSRRSSTAVCSRRWTAPTCRPTRSGRATACGSAGTTRRLPPRLLRRLPHPAGAGRGLRAHRRRQLQHHLHRGDPHEREELARPLAGPGVTYRVGVGANYLDDPTQGDVFVLSPPVQAPA